MKTFLFGALVSALLLLSACGNCPVGYAGSNGACYPATAGYAGVGAYPGIGYPGVGYPGVGYPGVGYPGVGYPGYPVGQVPVVVPVVVH